MDRPMFDLLNLLQETSAVEKSFQWYKKVINLVPVFVSTVEYISKTKSLGIPETTIAREQEGHVARPEVTEFHISRTSENCLHVRNV